MSCERPRSSLLRASISDPRQDLCPSLPKARLFALADRGRLATIPRPHGAIPAPKVSQTSRSVAQPGSAPAWGAGGRRFKSCRSDHSAGGGMDGASGFGDVGLRCKQHTPPPAILSLRPLILLVGKKLRRRRGSVRRAGASPDYHLTWPWRVHGWSVAPPCNDLYSLNHRPHASFAEGRSCTTPRLLQVVARGIRTARGRRRDHVASLCLLAHFSRYVAQPRVRWPHDDQCLCEHIEASDGRYVGHVPPDRGDAGGRRDRPSRVHRHWLRPCCRRAVSVATAASRH